MIILGCPPGHKTVMNRRVKACEKCVSQLQYDTYNFTLMLKSD